MSESVNIYEAKTRLSELVERASRGEEIVIARAGTPLARLVPMRVTERRPGALKSRIEMADDFDDLPDDVLREWLDDPREP